MVVAIVFFMVAWFWKSSALVTVPLALTYLGFIVWEYEWAFDFPMSEWELEYAARAVGTGILPLVSTMVALALPRRAGDGSRPDSPVDSPPGTVESAERDHF